MDYETSKKLKEAGFLQGGDGFGFYLMNDGTILNKKIHPLVIWNYIKEGFYEPTLEELIGACGDKFYSLERHRNDDWSAWAKAAVLLDQIGGKTPSEAVANLWLALNKKK